MVVKGEGGMTTAVVCIKEKCGKSGVGCVATAVEFGFGYIWKT